MKTVMTGTGRGGREEGYASHLSGASDFQDTVVTSLANFCGWQDINRAGEGSYNSFLAQSHQK